MAENVPSFVKNLSLQNDFFSPQSEAMQYYHHSQNSSFPPLSQQSPNPYILQR